MANQHTGTGPVPPAGEPPHSTISQPQPYGQTSMHQNQIHVGPSQQQQQPSTYPSSHPNLIGQGKMPMDPTCNLRSCNIIVGVMLIILAVLYLYELMDRPSQTECTELSSNLKLAEGKNLTLEEMKDLKSQCGHLSLGMLVTILLYSAVTLLAGLLIAIAACAKVAILALVAAALIVIAILMFLSQAVILYLLAPVRHLGLWMNYYDITPQKYIELRALAVKLNRAQVLISLFFVIILYAYFCMCAVGLYMQITYQKNYGNWIGATVVNQILPANEFLPPADSIIIHREHRKKVTVKEPESDKKPDRHAKKGKKSSKTKEEPSKVAHKNEKPDPDEKLKKVKGKEEPSKVANKSKKTDPEVSLKKVSNPRRSRKSVQRKTSKVHLEDRRGGPTSMGSFTEKANDI